MLVYQRVHPNIFLYLCTSWKPCPSPGDSGWHSQGHLAGSGTDSQGHCHGGETKLVHGTSFLFATKGCNFGGTSASEVAVFSWMCLVQGGIKHHWQEV